MDSLSNEENAVDYFCSIKDPRKLFEKYDEELKSKLKSLRYNCTSYNTLTQLSDAKFRQYVNFLFDYLEIYSEKFETFLTSNQQINAELDLFNDVIFLILNYTHYSTDFCLIFYETSSLQSLTFYLKCLVVNIVNVGKKNFFTKQCERIAGVLFNLSKYQEFFKEKFTELNISESLCDLINLIIGHDLFKEIYLVLFTTFSLIFNENDLSKLHNVNDGVNQISMLINQCADHLIRSDGSRREYTTIGEHFKKVDTLYLEDGWNLIELLECLYRLSIVDHLKNEIYYSQFLKYNLRTIIYDGNNDEKEYALKVLNQLCFDYGVSVDVSSDSRFFKTIKSFSNEENLGELSASIDFLIENNIGNKEVKIFNHHESYNSSTLLIRGREKPVNIPTKHIMISYNSKSRDLCLKIKNELEINGFNVWIDVENISGSSLESMAKAIEESSCFLMCMTEKYKQSANCRLEAEYAVNRNKPIIPLIMEKSYKPDGWLGIILGAKIFVDFTKHDFEECFKRLKREIDYLGVNGVIKVEPVDDKILFNSNSFLPPPIFNNFQKFVKKDVNSWSENEVKEWIKAKSFDKNIIKTIYPCNGEHLCQMFEMYQRIPEFFYNSLNTSKNVYLKDLVHFSNELKKLFQ